MICFAVPAATLPKLVGIWSSLPIITSPSSIPSTSFWASSNDIYVSSLVTSSTTVLLEYNLISPVAGSTLAVTLGIPVSFL